LEHDVPEQVAIERRDAVLAVRDEVLEASQRALVGSTIEVLIDEAHAGGRTPHAVGRTDMDAPEVDLIARLRGVDAAVGERVQVRVEELDSQFNLMCVPLSKPEKSAAQTPPRR
jgi:tRNA A37 methylthiotransferase MiaB